MSQSSPPLMKTLDEVLEKWLGQPLEGILPTEHFLQYRNALLIDIRPIFPFFPSTVFAPSQQDLNCKYHHVKRRRLASVSRRRVTDVFRWISKSRIKKGRADRTRREPSNGTFFRGYVYTAGRRRGALVYRHHHSHQLYPNHSSAQ